jgi:hypothetical protein
MEKLIKNVWRRDEGAPFERARILSKEIQPEGLDVERIRFAAPGKIALDPDAGHIASVIRGRVRLDGIEAGEGVHLYLPSGRAHAFEAEAGAELVHVEAPASQARGEKMIIRDEQFLSACAIGAQSLRWVLTPQYLSRRIFLHHDRTLTSKSGHPVSWFRTTMFDVSGLPVNEDGDPVFKMSYNSRTEFNVCYDVAGVARVRLARHPYAERRFDPWLVLDGDSTYHLNEAAGGPEEEWIEEAGERRSLRNRHEVHISGGHVSLFCLFDPAPTGIERHRPGEYSDYEPLTRIVGTPEYELHQREIGAFDDMLDRLSLAKATGGLAALDGTPALACYRAGKEAQRSIEAALADKLAADGRAAAIRIWMSEVDVQLEQ